MTDTDQKTHKTARPTNQLTDQQTDIPGQREVTLPINVVACCWQRCLIINRGIRQLVHLRNYNRRTDLVRNVRKLVSLWIADVRDKIFVSHGQSVPLSKTMHILEAQVVAFIFDHIHAMHPEPGRISAVS